MIIFRENMFRYPQSDIVRSWGYFYFLLYEVCEIRLGKPCVLGDTQDI